eukprot:TRINITY_DN8764_c0_g1_i1.p1 TRINITY_DN8764_c0_g1~~TRINITY_DN8764_c0_g1_i1.p1  ORF type:complete len:601 (+),score=82.13 TRINITY_DN8764_c0_g1_i1:24-1805(+)
MSDVPELPILALALSRGVEVKDRSYRLRRYPQCFIGLEAVRWLVRQGYATGPASAVALGNRLLDAGLLHHVHHEHRFKDEYLFYRFADGLETIAGTAGSIAPVSNARESQQTQLHADAPATATAAVPMAETARTTERSKTSVLTVGQTLLQQRVTMLELELARLRQAVEPAQVPPPQPPARSQTDSERLISQLEKRVDHLERDAFFMKAAVVCLLVLCVAQSLNHFWSRKVATFTFALVATAHMAYRYVFPAIGPSSRHRPGQPADRSSLYPAPHGASPHDPPQTLLGHESAAPPLGPTTLPPVEQWFHRPLCLRLCPAAQDQGLRLLRCGREDPESAGLPINDESTPIEFASRLFVGRAVVRLKGTPNSATSYFEGRQRRVQMTVQGRFTRRVPFSEVFTGEELDRPLRVSPPTWLLRSALGVVCRLSPGLRCEVEPPPGENEPLGGGSGARKGPYALNLLAATAQAVRADVPGSEPSVFAEIVDDPALLGAQFARDCAGLPQTAVTRRRKRYLGKRSGELNLWFEPNLVYTFDFYQHMLDAPAMRVEIGGTFSFDLPEYLGCQPIHFMAKAIGGSYLWNFELWHERALAYS